MLPKLNKPLGPFLSHYEIARGVEVDRALDDLAVSHAHILAHNLVDEMRLDIEALGGKDTFLYLFDGADDFMSRIPTLNIFLDLFASLIFVLILGN